MKRFFRSCAMYRAGGTFVDGEPSAIHRATTTLSNFNQSIGKTAVYGRGDGLSSPGEPGASRWATGRGQAIAPAIDGPSPQDVLDASTIEV